MPETKVSTANGTANEATTSAGSDEVSIVSLSFPSSEVIICDFGNSIRLFGALFCSFLRGKGSAGAVGDAFIVAAACPVAEAEVVVIS